MSGRTAFFKILSISLTVAACSPVGRSASQIAEQSLGAVGCKTAENEIWSSLQDVADKMETYPSAADLEAALRDVGLKRGLDGKAFETYVAAFLAYYETTTEGIRRFFAPTDTAGWKKALAEMELGVETTPLHKELKTEISERLKNLKAAEKELDPTCPNPEGENPDPQPPVPQGTIWEALRATENPEVSGIFKTLATAYQSCDVLALKPVSASTPAVQGITVIGNHPAGGLKREISSLAQVNATHYYIHGQRLAKNSCFEVRNSPLIYDFGGKPYTAATNPKELNMFKNGGSGTSVLGIDCSAFVFSSLALAGLKVDPSKTLKADLVHGIGSSAFKEPQSNGLKCLQKISVSATKTIEPGDIIAINGHVQIIDKVGADPFGLNAIQSVNDCNSSKISYTKFDFVVAQSSPSKGGIGINRFQARDYLAESSTFRDGVTRYAIAACKAKFGAASTIDSPSLSIVRHKRSADCQAAPLISTFESCVDSCRPL